MTHVDDAPSGREDRDSVLITVQQYLGGSTEDRAAGHLATAWDLFYETYMPLIDVMVLSSRLSKHEAEDCAQEVWLELVRCFPRLKGLDAPAGFSGWLATIVRSQVARQIRANAKRLALIEGERARLNGMTDSDDDFDRFDDRELVANALAQLERQTSELTTCGFWYSGDRHHSTVS